ncbi:hypothetical protein [Streptomyces sp. SID3212]|nr:hypothetical protein [Streptomyces sp. SID3212]
MNAAIARVKEAKTDVELARKAKPLAEAEAEYAAAKAELTSLL